MAENPPAFPRECTTFDWELRDAQEGMTLRDWFAGQALPAAITYCEKHRDDPTIASMPLGQAWAHLSYLIADDMLSEREKAS